VIPHCRLRNEDEIERDHGTLYILESLFEIASRFEQ
jgi:hypothetical protein